MNFKIKRLGEADFHDYRKIRIKAFEQHEYEFRFSPEDEIKLSKETVIKRLKSDFIVGAHDDDNIIGIAGITKYIGSKIQHRALLWGMYVNPQYRGKDVATSLISSLINFATDIGIEKILLTVVNTNLNAIYFYKKWGFVPYAIDPYAVKLLNGNYLDEMLMVKNIS